MARECKSCLAIKADGAFYSQCRSVCRDCYVERCKERYRRARAAGLCTRCRKRPAGKESMCSACVDKLTASRRSEPGAFAGLSDGDEERPRCRCGLSLPCAGCPSIYSYAAKRVAE